MPQRERSEKTEGKTEVWPARRLAVSQAVPLTQWLTSELQRHGTLVGALKSRSSVLVPEDFDLDTLPEFQVCRFG